MELIEATELVNSGIANVVSNKKDKLVEALSRNGFVTNIYESDADVIYKTLSANQLSKDFRTDLANLIASNHSGATLGFAAQQDLTVHYTLNDLSFGTTHGTPEHMYTNSGMYTHADGSSKTSWLDTINSALNAYTQTQMTKAQTDTSNAVLQHDQNQILLKQQEAEAAAQGGKNLTSYILPVALIGALLIGGIFVYRKLKK